MTTENEISSKKVFMNLIWRFAERSGAQIVQFVVSIILARILMPSDYGTVALVLVFAQLFQVFVDSGLGNALIQKKDADDLDFSSVFYFNVVWCFILYFLLFLAAPYIAQFYHNNSLCNIIRVLCITIIISGFKNVQQAYISRNMQFKKFFFATLTGTVCSAVVGILVAKLGLGPWAIVAQKLTNLAIDTIALWFVVDWRPKLIFSLERLKVLLSFGWKLLVAAILDTLYNNLRTLIIGRLYSEDDLAFYNQGKQFPDIIVTNINASIDSVLLPALSRSQEDRQRVKEMTRRSIKTSVYIMAPLMLGIAFSAKTIVTVILTDKWLPCVPILRIFCIAYIFFPIHTANLNAIKALGRSDVFLKLEIIKKIVGVVILLISMRFGIIWIAISLLISDFLWQIINAWPNKKLINYSYMEQIQDIVPIIIIATIMGIVIVPLQFLKIHPIIILLLQVLLGIVVYLLESVIFKIDSYSYLLSIVKPIFSKVLKRKG